jgi:uncharacterized protein with HEPN domain
VNRVPVYTKFHDTKFLKKNLLSYFAKLLYYFAKFSEISQTNIAKFCKNTEHAHPGHVKKYQIGQDKKVRENATLSTKFCNLYLRDFAEFRDIIVMKFREINFNFVFREIKNRLSYPP